MRNAVILAAALALAVPSAGCTTTRGARIGALVAGGAMVVGGGYLAHALNDEEGSGIVGCLNDGCALTVAMMVGGTILAIAGAASSDDDTDEAPAAATVQLGAPGLSPSYAPPKQTLRPLPERDADPDTIRLAKQTRSAALRGDCRTVDVMLAQIAERDPGYRDALRAGPVTEGCR